MLPEALNSLCLKTLKKNIFETEFCFPLDSDRLFPSSHSITFLMHYGIEPHDMLEKHS